MKPSRKSANPFYALLVVCGTAFVVTAAAYGVMTVREAQLPTAASAESAEHPLIAWMDRYGNAAILVELALLGVSTVAAIATDEFWQRRATSKHQATATGRATES